MLDQATHLNDHEDMPIKVERLQDEPQLTTPVEVEFEPISHATTHTEDESDQHQSRDEMECDLASMIKEYHANTEAEADMTMGGQPQDTLRAFNERNIDTFMKSGMDLDTRSDEIGPDPPDHIIQQAFTHNLRELQNNERRDEHESDEEVQDLDATPLKQEIDLTDADLPFEISEEEENEDPATTMAAKSNSTGNRSKRRTSSTLGKSRITKPVAQRRRRERQNASMLNFESLMRNDVVADAHANQGMAEQPSIQGHTRRADALKALIASVPEEQQNTIHGMQTKLNDACKQFKWKGNGSMKADGDKGWRLKGMASSLKHFQLLGAGFGVNREKGEAPPFGGMLSDTMGYGKTVQMIAIMVENQPKSTDRYRTTLIVVPNSIVTQWVQEIVKHTSDTVMENIFVYKAGSRISGVDPYKALQKYQIVITTYHELARQYPKCTPPTHLTTDKAIDAWWESYYEKNRGLFLKMRFHRVVLDEAQYIKNHESRMSKACRQVSAKYKWVLTGTPLSNRLEELFPYFNFLGVEGADSYAQFKHNYGQRKDSTMQRLDAMLRLIMVRRTGASRMFGLPLVSLPALDHQTVTISFNPIEKVVYETVRQRFINRINNWSISNKLQQFKANVWVMLMRLRQMCAHILMVSATFQNLLEPEDIKKLWQATEQHFNSVTDSTNRKTAVALRKLIQEAQNENSQTHNQSTSFSTNKPQETVDLTNDEGELRHQNESICCSCKDTPSKNDARLLAPCDHFYCISCVDLLLNTARLRGVSAQCRVCKVEISALVSTTTSEQITVGKDPEFLFGDTSTDIPTIKSGKNKNGAAAMKWLSLPGAALMSTKIQAVTAQIQEWITKDPGAKIIVFSLFLAVMKCLAKVCHRKGWGFQEYTGEMSNDLRESALQEWKSPDSDQKLLIMSMQAGGLGLNLTEASYVIIFDPWWNEPVEHQAFSRVYRIGQRRDCVVRRFVLADAVDTQLMLYKQKIKAEECNRVIDGRVKATLSTPELLKLFGPTKRHPETNEIVIEEGEEDDGIEEFVVTEDRQTIDSSDNGETMPTPARPSVA